MAIVFDEIEATVLPDTAPKSTTATASGGDASAQADPHALQSALVRMMERAHRLQAD